MMKIISQACKFKRGMLLLGLLLLTGAGWWKGYGAYGRKPV